MRATVADGRLQSELDLAARFCVVFGIATVISVVFLAAHGWWLMAAAVSLTGALLSYRAALAAAAAYGQAVEAAFDLHRFDLLTALQLPLPANLTGEVTANQELSRFLRQPAEYLHALTQAQRGLNFTYSHPAVRNDPGGNGA
jgi:hypothetical protein